MDVNSQGYEEVDQEEFDALMMRAALDLARRGAGLVSPNPMVGAVVVDERRRVIGEGWHQRFGEAHAEANALTSVEGRDLSRATMYVTLEPCSHQGKTPPCADALVASGIGRVVVAMRDPNPLVSGRGNRRLREAGVKVEVGLLEQEARQLNEAYMHHVTTGMPFVVIKMAQTLDGFTALPSGESKWITGEASRRRVHEMRAVFDAVMVGTQTALVDNPTLTVRHGVQGRQPRRVTLDRQLAIPEDHHLVSDEHRHLTYIFTAEELAESRRARELRSAGVNVIGLPVTGNGLLLRELFRHLSEEGIASVLVEGGSRLAGALIREELARKLILFVGPRLFGQGFTSFADLNVGAMDEAVSLVFRRVIPIAEDIMIEAYLADE